MEKSHFFPLCTAENKHHPLNVLLCVFFNSLTVLFLLDNWQGGEKKKVISKTFCILDFFLQPWNSHLTLCDMCSGVSISSNIAPFTLEPLRLASWRSQPDRSQFCKTKTIFMKFRWRFRAFSVPSQNDSWGTKFMLSWKSVISGKRLF